MATLYAGTSGFAYPQWKPAFYPAEVPASRFLEHYAERLNAVEINYTFRRMPARQTLESWVAKSRQGFTFAVKAHQRITHWLRLRGAEEPTAALLGALEPLREAGRLGPVLLQLPPRLELDLERLAAYLSLLPRDWRFTVEFRHRSWLVDQVYELLHEHGVALCVAEAEGFETPDVTTASFSYYRLRKPAYGPDDLRRLEARALELVGAGHDTYMFFKHEDDPDGALAAERLLSATR